MYFFLSKETERLDICPERASTIFVMIQRLDFFLRLDFFTLDFFNYFLQAANQIHVSRPQTKCHELSASGIVMSGKIVSSVPAAGERLPDRI